MDLNYLYFRHQVSLMSADAAGGVEAQRAHRGLAELYASIIDTARRDRPSGGPRAFLLKRRAARPAATAARSR